MQNLEKFRQSPALQPLNIVQRGEDGICANVEFVGEAVRYQSEGQLTRRDSPHLFGAAAALNQDWKTSQNKHRITS